VDTEIFHKIVILRSETTKNLVLYVTNSEILRSRCKWSLRKTHQVTPWFTTVIPLIEQSWIIHQWWFG